MQIIISQRDFFSLPEVVNAQNIQKRFPYGSPEHRAAFEEIKRVAVTHGVQSFIGDYED